ncbi:MAG TPA: hypothetical protein VIU37_12690 [Candidatus Limnocylindrales bacterium]
MNERTVAEALAAYFEDEIEIATTYGYPISNSDGPLPDAVCFCREKRLTRDPGEIAEIGLEQIWVRLFTCEVSIMVEVAEQTEAAADAADAELRGYGAAVEDSVWADQSLGDRVPYCSPAITCDYSTPFIRREDGVTGRLGIITLLVAEPVGHPE